MNAFEFDYGDPGALIYNDFLNTLCLLNLISREFYYEHEHIDIEDDYYNWEDDEIYNEN